MAVEPRKIKQPTDSGTAALDEVGGRMSASASDGSGEKKKLPIIPILAGLVALLVVGLLGKVVLSK